MGVSEYPEVFFCVDSAYYLGQIHALVSHNGFPPASLSSLGETFPYHYGIQEMAAILVYLTGLPAHTCAFLVIMPLLSAGTVSALWLFTSNHKSSFPSVLGLIILIGAIGITSYDINKMLQLLLFGNSYGLSQFLFVDPETLGNHFPMMSTQFAFFCAATLIYCLHEPKDINFKAVLPYSVGILLAFKSSAFVTLGAGLGVWCCIQAIKIKKWSPLLLPLAALIVALLLHKFLFNIGGWAKVTLAPFYHLLEIARPWHKGTVNIFNAHNWRVIAECLGGLFLVLSINCMPLLPCLMLLKAKYSKSLFKPALLSLAFVLPPLVFVNMFIITDYRVPNEPLPTTFSKDVLMMLPLFLAASTVLLIKSNWKELGVIQKQLTVCLLTFAAVIVPICGRLFTIWVLLFTPQYGHEYVDNRALADVLQKIPIKATVLVTNDLRYPAQNYKRDLRQMQFPAIFGHQCWAINFKYERYPDSNKRLEIQERFATAKWDPELKTMAEKYGWTHLVLHLNALHPKTIPLFFIYANTDYAVYAFKSY